LIKTSSKKKKRTRAPGGQSSGGQKKRRIYERSRRKKRRETTEDEIKTIANGAIYHRHSRVSSFFLSISLFSSPPRGKVGEGKKKRERILKVCFSIWHMPYSPFELSLLRKTERNIFPLFLFQIPLTTTTHNNNNNNAL